MKTQSVMPKTNTITFGEIDDYYTPSRNMSGYERERQEFIDLRQDNKISYEMTCDMLEDLEEEENFKDKLKLSSDSFECNGCKKASRGFWKRLFRIR